MYRPAPTPDGYCLTSEQIIQLLDHLRHQGFQTTRLMYLRQLIVVGRDPEWKH